MAPITLAAVCDSQQGFVFAAGVFGCHADPRGMLAQVARDMLEQGREQFRTSCAG
jgi:hypothetical protein